MSVLLCVFDYFERAAERATAMKVGTKKTRSAPNSKSPEFHSVLGPGAQFIFRYAGPIIEYWETELPLE